MSGLNVAVANSEVTSWKVGIELDGTLTFKVTETSGDVTEGGARQLGSRF